jgi:hypothetical protein
VGEKLADGTILRYGVTFDCPHCGETRLGVCFQPVIRVTGAAPGDELWSQHPGLRVWRRDPATNDFSDLTLSPSIDAETNHGHWHGHITQGQVDP